MLHAPRDWFRILTAVTMAGLAGHARVSGAADVVCPTASSPPASRVYVGEPTPVPRGFQLLGSFDIVLNAGSNLTGNPAALAAFERAASWWEAYIADPVTVTIDADIDALGTGGPLGVTSNPLEVVSYTAARNAMVADAADEADDGVVSSLPTLAELALLYPGGAYSFDGTIWMTKPNMLALGLGPSGPNPSITFNSDFPFDYDNSDGVTFSQFDFESVAIHEIAHALGFVSVIDAIDTFGPGAYGISPLDLFRFQRDTANDPATASEFTMFPRGQAPGDDEITDDLVDEWRMSTGLSGDSRQASHWKANELTGVQIGVMDPTISNGTIASITVADIRALDVVGWEIVSGVTVTTSTTTTTLPPAICGLSPEPSANCKLVTTPLKGALQLKDSANDAKDSLKWTWAKGVAIAAADFKDPLNGTPTLQFCVYDSSANAQPLLAATIPPGGTCGGNPCWKGSPTASPTSYSLTNKAGTPQGVTKAKLKAGVALKGKVQVGGKGLDLAMPPLGLTLPVTAQLLIDDGVTTECWQTTYGAASANDAGQFKAKGP